MWERVHVKLLTLLLLTASILFLIHVHDSNNINNSKKIIDYIQLNDAVTIEVKKTWEYHSNYLDLASSTLVGEDCQILYNNLSNIKISNSGSSVPFTTTFKYYVTAKDSNENEICRLRFYETGVSISFYTGSKAGTCECYRVVSKKVIEEYFDSILPEHSTNGLNAHFNEVN